MNKIIKNNKILTGFSKLKKKREMKEYYLKNNQEKLCKIYTKNRASF